MVSGPSGSGKSSLCRELCKNSAFYLSISSTTRTPRAGEEHGKDYFFTSKDDFTRGIKEGRFLEWAEVHGNFYGTDKLKIKEQLALGKTVVFDIDVQGQEIIKSKHKSFVTSVFVTTKDVDTLKERLECRATETPQSIDLRLKNARVEMQKIPSYDFLIINDDFARSLQALAQIAACLDFKQTGALDEFLKDWENNSKG